MTAVGRLVVGEGGGRGSEGLVIRKSRGLLRESRVLVVRGPRRLVVRE